MSNKKALRTHTKELHNLQLTIGCLLRIHWACIGSQLTSIRRRSHGWRLAIACGGSIATVLSILLQQSSRDGLLNAPRVSLPDSHPRLI